LALGKNISVPFNFAAGPCISIQADNLSKFRLISSREKLNSHGTIFPAWERAFTRKKTLCEASERQIAEMAGLRPENSVPMRSDPLYCLIEGFMSSGLPKKRLRQARIDSQPAVSGMAKVAKLYIERSTGDERR